jgi:LysR family transcriptional activator of nhaA
MAGAAKRLRLSHPTISAQIHALEGALGQKLLEREGRRLVLTETGRLVLRYADEIFTLGQEMQQAVDGRPIGGTLRLMVGVADALPKLIIRRLMEPVWGLPQTVRAVIREDRPDRLLTDLAASILDVVLLDTPVPSGARVRAFNHLLGESGITLFGTRELVAGRRRGFPASLKGAPMLLPMEGSALRRSLDQWLDGLGIQPRVVAECDDSALLKSLGQSGMGLFAAPSVLEDEIVRQYGVKVLAQVPGVNERFYAISLQRRLKHPAVVAMLDGARSSVSFQKS